VRRRVWTKQGIRIVLLRSMKELIIFELEEGSCGVSFERSKTREKERKNEVVSRKNRQNTMERV